MKTTVTKDLLDIFQRILEEDKTVDEWAEIESGDMFQSPRFVGGFDATERAFCFSFYDDGKEYWFQLTLDELKQMFEMGSGEIELRLASY